MTQSTPPPPGTPASDLPAVPRAKPSGMAKVLAVLGALIVAGYAGTAYTDYEPGSPSREQIPASMRSGTGGYRSFHFWHSGYHGGK